MNDSDTADKFIAGVKEQMDSTSNVAKFELQQKLTEEWLSMTCGQRIATGKAIETKTQDVSDREVKATFNFNPYSNSMSSLEFSRYTGNWSFGFAGLPDYKYDKLIISNPMKGCTVNDRQR
ncbi:MAG: hypothetical protein K2X77_30480 [Candidatus Obscuribacterales bacterium]|nr:hypothetical protein [Candidatus Obscuribacterales bacterium]